MTNKEVIKNLLDALIKSKTSLKDNRYIKLIFNALEQTEDISYVDSYIDRCKSGKFEGIVPQDMWILPVLFADDFPIWKEIYPANEVPYFHIRLFLDQLILKIYPAKYSKAHNRYMDILEKRYYDMTGKLYEPNFKLPTEIFLS